MMWLFTLSFMLLAGWFATAAANASAFVIYAFSQSDVSEEDQQVYELVPDVTIRAIGKWSNNGSEVEDYNFAQVTRYHQRGITFMGSGTASVIFPQDFATTEIFNDMSTRDADGNIVPHDEFGFAIPAKRGNIFNPAYRKYLLDWAKIQVDGAVDGVNFDEVNAGFSGGQKYGFNGNEGFDNYALADFNTYLLSKYPTFSPQDWKNKFKMSPENIITHNLPAGDLSRNFNYRSYLKANNWSANPLDAANPLAAEWGKVTANRMYADDTSFTATYVRLYWKEIVDTLRKYARTSAGREILISSNGLWPYVDFNSVGMYPWNPDEQTADYRGADYVPILDGHLNGAKSLQAQYRKLKEQNRLIAGDVPVAVFIDWPNDMMSGYLGLPLEEKKDYWRIFGAEAYANGLFPSFHLRDTVGSPTAKDVGILDFFKEYTAFYRRHGALFKENTPVSLELVSSARNVTASLLVQRGTGQRSLHLVNHNYEGKIIPQAGFTVSFPAGVSCPREVSVVSPDGEQAAGKVTATCIAGALTVAVDRLVYYSAISLWD
jgi:hypothetical protein